MGLQGVKPGSPPRRGGRRENLYHRGHPSTSPSTPLGASAKTGQAPGHRGHRLLFAAFAWRLLAHGFTLWRLCYDQIVGLANQGFEFRGGQDVGVCQKYPFVAADVGGLGDAFDFEEFVEFFRSAFKANGREVALREVDDGEEFASHLEAQVFGPLDVFGRVGEGEAEFADPFDVGHVGDDSAVGLLLESRAPSPAGRARTPVAPADTTLDLWLRPAPPLLPPVSSPGRWLPSRCRRHGVCS